MDSNDTVPVGVAVAVFAALGVLIVAAFGFAVWSVFNLRDSTAGTVLALGKTIEFAEAPEVEEIPYEYDATTLRVEIFGLERREAVFDGYEVMYDATEVSATMGFADEDSFELIDDEIFIRADLMNFIFSTMGYDEPWDEDDEPVSAFAVLGDLGYLVSFDAEQSVLSIHAPQPEDEPEPAPEPAPVRAAPAARPQATPAPTPEFTPEFTPALTPAVTWEHQPTLVAVRCGPCGGGGTVICTGCDGIGGGREMLLAPGIPHEFAESGLQWWCTVCMAQTRITCGTCNGTGSVLSPG